MKHFKSLRNLMFQLAFWRNGCPVRVGSKTLRLHPDFRRCNSEKDALADALDANLRPGMTFVDVGANIGLYSVYAVACVGSQGSVYSFEPDKENMLSLMRNIRYCSSKAHITAVESAVSDDATKSTLSFFVPHDTGGAPQSEASLKPSVEGMREVTVHNTTLDAFFSDKPRVDFIKIDTEGAELLVLKGAAALIKRDRPVLCIEYHGGKCNDFGYAVDDLKTLIQAYGYSEEVIWQGTSVCYYQTIAKPCEQNRPCS